MSCCRTESNNWDKDKDSKSGDKDCTCLTSLIINDIRIARLVSNPIEIFLPSGPSTVKSAISVLQDQGNKEGQTCAAGIPDVPVLFISLLLSLFCKLGRRSRSILCPEVTSTRMGFVPSPPSVSWLLVVGQDRSSQSYAAPFHIFSCSMSSKELPKHSPLRIST
jgi:hypothetical protein